jgi:hypothetical protein
MRIWGLEPEQLMVRKRSFGVDMAEPSLAGVNSDTKTR